MTDINKMTATQLISYIAHIQSKFDDNNPLVSELKKYSEMPECVGYALRKIGKKTEVTLTFEPSITLDDASVVTELKRVGDGTKWFSDGIVALQEKGQLVMDQHAQAIADAKAVLKGKL